MRPIRPFAQRALALFCGGLISCFAQAELKPMADSELAEVTGQAMITLDGLTYGGFEYTRVNIGADIDLLTNIDELRLGNYSRSGANTVSSQPADIWIDNFALGRIDNANSSDATIVPFQIRDPYVEFAFKVNAQGVREVAGIRLGFGRARGDLSGDIRSLTGVMQGLVTGSASTAREYYMQQNGLNSLTCAFDFNCLALSLAGDTEIYSEVQLVKSGTGETTINGQPINRATDIGVAKGDSFQTDNALLKGILPLIAANNGDCKASGLPACFALLNYKSIFVGDRTQTDLNLGGAQGIFFSLQNQNVPWQDLAAANARFVETQSGAFANFAKTGEGANAIYPFIVSLYEALNGTARVPTCMGQGKGC
ncbi:hypothetical protein BZL41_08040 [Pseudomonas sp. PIC25]|uniref:DUF6160 family protein n=1 Tax=Pseudomonas sp. PIC25 TaxID=1958773 RepID=UPI000BABB700|nr:DUF6160 family protein [Pseudomonas sp. PIC25]PAU64988.1 hypothetical protein BZL41_08040 [Pseudomonas sp. PIC25]